jgi:O-antigen/teichoic acid export membrane protein
MAKNLNFQEIPGRDLYPKVVKGGFWVFGLRFFRQLFHCARLIILARLLSPHDFGLFGVALLTMSILETFSQTGFKQALIQKKERTEEFLNSAWTFLVIRGVVLFSLLYLVAPNAAEFFGVPEAKRIIQVMGLSILLSSLTNIGVIYFQKELEFNKQFVLNFITVAVDFIVAVSAALMMRNVWALVLGVLAGNITGLVLSFVLHPFRPRFKLNRQEVKGLFRFGKWVLGSSVLVFLITQGDDIFVGKLLGVAMLGFYQMAYKISNMPTTEISHVISQVTFPAYSKIQENLPRLREAYLKVLQLTAFLSFPIAGLIFVFAPDFTRIFLGEKWMPIVPAMQILVFAGFIRSIAVNSGFVFLAVGKPKIDTFWQIVRFIVIGILIYPFSKQMGIAGTSLVILFSIVISGVGFSLSAIKVTQCGLKEFMRSLGLPMINGICVILLIVGLKSFLVMGMGMFVLLAAVGIGAYILISFVLDNFYAFPMRSLIRSGLMAFKGV